MKIETTFHKLDTVKNKIAKLEREVIDKASDLGIANAEKEAAEYLNGEAYEAMKSCIDKLHSVKDRYEHMLEGLTKIENEKRAL